MIFDHLSPIFGKPICEIYVCAWLYRVSQLVRSSRSSFFAFSIASISAFRRALYFSYASTNAVFVFGPKFPAPVSSIDCTIHWSFWNVKIMRFTSPHSTIYPRLANASMMSLEIPHCDWAFAAGKSVRFTRPISIHSRSIGLRLLISSIMIHFTSRTHQLLARRSQVSPYHIQISIRSCGCPRTHASTIAHPLSSTRPSPSPGKKICVPKA